MTADRRPTQTDDVRGPHRRQLEIEELLAIERATTKVIEPMARMWLDLIATGDRAVTTRSLDAALRDALVTIGDLLSVQTVAILLANEAGDELTARAAVGLREELSVDLGIRAGEGMSGRVLESGGPLVVGDLSAVDVVDPVLRDSGLRSLAAVPMFGEGRPLGVMWAASPESDRLTVADAELLQVVADRLATALERVRVLQRERTARREAERLADRVARIQRATAELASSYSPGEIADAVVRVLDSEPPVWRAVWLLHGDRYEILAQSSDPPPAWRVNAGLEDDAALAAALRNGHPTFGVASDSGAGESSWAVLPIATRSGQAAALAVVAGRTDWFTPDERLLLALVTGQAGQAFERASLAAAERQAAERATFFARAAQVLAEAGDLAETLERLGDLVVTTLCEICLIDVVGEDGQLARMVAKHRDPALQPLVDRLRTDYPPDARGAHPGVRAIGSGQASWSEAVDDAFLRATTLNEEHLQLVRDLGFRSYLTVPLVAAGRVLGSVTCVSTTRPLHRDDLCFTEELAQHVASVIDNARRYESAFRTSQILQSSLLPADLPEVAGVTIETRYLAANRGLEVGGDFYDVLELPTTGVLFMVGDVAGHDRAAAAQMGHLRSAARALAGRASTPSALISALRDAWRLLSFERVATTVVGSLDPSSGDLVVASAGHHPPLLVTETGAAFLPVVPGPLLGIKAPPVAEWRGTLGAGQVLLGYTDGAVDERAAGGEPPMACLARVATQGAITPVGVCDRVVAAIASERADDVALMAIALDAR